MANAFSQPASLPLTVVGFGRFARRRLVPAFADCRDGHFAAVVDPEATVDDLPAGVSIYRTLKQFFAADPRGAAYVAAPNALHASLSTRCLDQGLSVLCEKPMAIASGECDRMIEAARAHGSHLWVGHMLRHSPALGVAKQLLDQGAIGQPRTADLAFLYNLPSAQRTWAGTRDQAGGGVLLDAGIHCIDTLRWLLGEPVLPEFCEVDQPPDSPAVERSARCRLTVGGCSCTMRLSSTSDYLTRLEVTGAEGALQVDRFAACHEHARVTVQPHSQATPSVCQDIDVSAVYGAQLQAFVHSVNEPPDLAKASTARDNVVTVEQLYQISESLGAGAPA